MQKHRYIKYGLWMSEEEDHALQKICDQSGLSRAAVLRKMITGSPIRERPNADFLSLTDAIEKIGVNFNQLIRKVNTTGAASDHDLKEAKRAYQQVLRLMREWEKTWR